MNPSPDSRATSHRKQGVLIALFLALVMVFVGGGKTSTQGSLGEPTDHGLIGAAAERAQAESLPTGKPINEATSESAEAEREREIDDDSKIATAWAALASIETQWFADRAHGLDAPSDLRAWRSCASLGARGPPVG